MPQLNLKLQTFRKITACWLSARRAILCVCMKGPTDVRDQLIPRNSVQLGPDRQILIMCAAGSYYSGLWTHDVPGSNPLSGCQIIAACRLDRLHRAYPSLHPYRGRTLGTSPVEASRQRLGVNRIDSWNFELCSEGQLCITMGSTVFKDWLDNNGKYVAGLSSSQCLK